MGVAVGAAMMRLRFATAVFAMLMGMSKSEVYSKFQLAALKRLMTVFYLD